MPYIDNVVFNDLNLKIRDVEAQGRLSTLEKTSTEEKERLDAVAWNVNGLLNDVSNLKISEPQTAATAATAKTTADENKAKIEGEIVPRLTSVEALATSAENIALADKDRVDDLVVKVPNMATDIESLKTTTAQNSGDIETLQAHAQTVDTEIEELDQRIVASTYEAGAGIYFGEGEAHTNINIDDEVLEQINKNAVNITNMDAEIDTLQGLVSSIDEEVGALQTDVGTLQADAADLKTRVSTAENAINSNAEEIGAAKASIAAIDTRVGTLETDVEPLKPLAGEFSELSTKVDGFDGRITQSETDIQVLQTDLSNTDRRVTTNTSDLQKTNDVVKNLTTVSLSPNAETVGTPQKEVRIFPDSALKINSLTGQIYAEAAVGGGLVYGYTSDADQSAALRMATPLLNTLTGQSFIVGSNIQYGIINDLSMQNIYVKAVGDKFWPNGGNIIPSSDEILQRFVASTFADGDAVPHLLYCPTNSINLDSVGVSGFLATIDKIGTDDLALQFSFVAPTNIQREGLPSFIFGGAIYTMSYGVFDQPGYIGFSYLKPLDGIKVLTIKDFQGNIIAQSTI